MAAPHRARPREWARPAPVPAPDGQGPILEARIRRQLSVAIPAANVLGALVVFVFMSYVFPTPLDDSSLKRLNLVVFVALLPVALVVGRRLSLRTSAVTMAWMDADRVPTEQERDIALREPLRLAGVSAGLWVAGAVIFSALNATRSAALALEVAFAVLLGGLATCALIYLLVERVGRPEAARALAIGPPARPALPGVATRALLAWSIGSGIAIVGSGLVAAEYLAGSLDSARRVAGTVLFLSVMALLAGGLMVLFAARSVADPVDSVRRALAEVESGNVDVEVPVYDGSEVGMLQAGFNRMVAGLRDRDRLADLFGRHVGVDVAREALARGVELGGEVREVAVLFVDILGSTRLAATRDPRVVVDVLNRFFAVVVDTVTAHGGWVNKFEGDAALCVFGAPTPHPSAAAGALASARTLAERLDARVPEVRAAIGVSAGSVVAGNVGAAQRFEYTVIGDAVNEAARLTELAKAAPGRVLASEAILSRVDSAETRRWRLGDPVILRGRTAATRVAELA